MSIVGICGVAGTGKTTIMKEFLKETDDWIIIKPEPLLDSLYSKKLDCYVLGKYSPYYDKAPVGYAEGTDRLSMAVQQNALTFFTSLKSNCIFEGDRLSNLSVFHHIIGTGKPCMFVMLQSNLLEQRYKERGSNQSMKFIKGRFTKYSNIEGDFKIRQHLKVFNNNKTEDIVSINKAITEFLLNRKG